MTEIFTIGYEGLNPQSFFELLTRCGIEMLVDVRDLPISRKSGFSKNPLSAGCEQNELEYRHVPELGCPRDIRHGYRDDGNWARYTKHFLAHLKTQKTALSEVASLAGRRRICLLCFEKDFNFCHRTYVAEALARFTGDGVKISHLTGPIKGRVVVRTEAVAA